MSELGASVVSSHVREHWWRLVPVAFACAVFGWRGVVAGVFGLLPVLIWCCVARTRTAGLVVGLVQLVLLARFVVPGELGASGPWVPAPTEIYWLYPVLAGLACVIGTVRTPERLVAGCAAHALIVFVGICVAVLAVGLRDEGPPGDEGVLPGPSSLRVVEQEMLCASGGCWRVVVGTGERAPEVMRGHLGSRGYVHPRGEDLCRRTGVVEAHEVCATLTTVAPDVIKVEWKVR